MIRNPWRSSHPRCSFCGLPFLGSFAFLFPPSFFSTFLDDQAFSFAPLLPRWFPFNSISVSRSLWPDVPVTANLPYGSLLETYFFIDDFDFCMASLAWRAARVSLTGCFWLSLNWRLDVVCGHLVDGRSGGLTASRIVLAAAGYGTWEKCW